MSNSLPNPHAKRDLGKYEGNFYRERLDHSDRCECVDCKDDCDLHEVAEGTEIKIGRKGILVSECRKCGNDILAKEIDHEWFKDCDEVVVLEWEVME